MWHGTDTNNTVRQLNRWFATFCASRTIRCDKGLPFFSNGFKDFCNEYCIKLNLTPLTARRAWVPLKEA